MARTPEIGTFKPKPSDREGKSDATTRAAREIIEHATNARLAKTERLRAIRLAKDAETESTPPKKASQKRNRKR
jgi:hypothetical protein